MNRKPSNRTHRSASWTRVLLTQEDRLQKRLTRRLQERHWLRLHAALTGGLSLAGMSLLSLGLLHAGMDSMALRYGISLACGYLLYLLLVRLWAGCMLRRDWNLGDVPADLPGGSVRTAGPDVAGSFESGQGGSFGGGGAQGDWGSDSASVLDSAPSLGEVAGSGSSGIDIGDIGGLDEGAVVVVPVLLLFAGLLLAVTGVGSLLWLVFGADLFLTVAVEVAFALLMTRTLYVVEREGWLLAALRMSWKPMLGALVAAVLLGALADWCFPQADTLVQVLRRL